MSSASSSSARACGKCTLDLPVNGDYVVCSHCESKYHFNECSGVAPNTWERKPADKKLSWRCISCRKGTEQISLADIKIVLHNMSNKMEQLQISVDQSNEKLNDALVMIQELRKENEALKIENKDLRNRVCSLEQYSRSNNVIINNLPTTDKENIIQIVQKIGEVTGTAIDPADVDCCHRLRKSPKQTYPSIVVRFTRRTIKQALLKNSKKKIIMHDQIGVPVDTRNPKIYINEHLTSENMKLLATAKSLYDHDFKFVWCRDGKIFARENEESSVLRITTPEQISKIISRGFGQGTQL